jgi:hypothetical protein
MAAGDIYLWTGPAWILQGGGEPPPPVDPYEEAVLVDDPTVLYMMADEIAETAADGSVSGITGSYVSGHDPLSDGFVSYQLDDVNNRRVMGFLEATLDGSTSQLHTTAEVAISGEAAITFGWLALLTPGGRTYVFGGTNTEEQNVVVEVGVQDGAQSVYVSVQDEVGGEEWFVLYTGTDAVSDGVWHFVSVVLYRDDPPSVLIDDVPLSLALDDGAHPTPGPFEANLAGGWQFMAGADNGSGETQFLAGGYAMPGELDAGRRTAHYDAAFV